MIKWTSVFIRLKHTAYQQIYRIIIAVVLQRSGEPEIRCVRRKLLLEAMARELPIGTIKYSSKVVSIEESGYFKLVHLADGSILKTKVTVYASSEKIQY